MSFADLERSIVDYFETAGCDVEQEGLEWFLSLYDEGPAISLTALALALTRPHGGCGTPGCTDHPDCDYGRGPNTDPLSSQEQK